jgi:hypothetical protein
MMLNIIIERMTSFGTHVGILPLIPGYGMAADSGSVGESQFKYSLETCNSVGILVIEGLSGVLHGIRFLSP